MDSERWDKFSAGVTVKFTAPTTTHVEERQPECSQGHSKCEQEDWVAASNLERIKPYRQDKCWVEAYTVGFFQTSIFRHSPLGGRMDGAQWHQWERKFLPCFSCSVNTMFSHRKFSMGYRRARSTQGNTNFQKSIFFDKHLRDHYPRALKLNRKFV